MNPRERIYKARILGTNTETQTATILRTDLYYTDRRGYFASTNVFRIGKSAFGKSEESWPLDAVRVLLLPARRFNAKTLATIDPDPAIIEKLEREALAKSEERKAAGREY